MAGKGSAKTKMIVPIYFIAGIFLTFISVFLLKSLGDYRIYKSHSWIETEARFVSSEEYQHSVRRRKHTGATRYRTVQETRYRWQYCYEINGEQYSYITDNHKESQPESQNQSIMVATDDPFTYLRYANGGALAVMLVFSLVIAVLGGLVIVGLIIVSIKLQKKNASG